MGRRAVTEPAVAVTSELSSLDSIKLFPRVRTMSIRHEVAGETYASLLCITLNVRRIVVSFIGTSRNTEPIPDGAK